MPSSDDGGCSAGGNSLTTLINTVTGTSPSSQIRTTAQIAGLQEGFRSPRAKAQDDDVVSLEITPVS
jgi:hypothetical protein